MANYNNNLFVILVILFLQLFYFVGMHSHAYIIIIIFIVYKSDSVTHFLFADNSIDMNDKEILMERRQLRIPCRLSSDSIPITNLSPTWFVIFLLIDE